MQGVLQYKSKQFFFVLIKISIVVCAFYFIQFKLKNNAELDFSAFIEFLTESTGFSLKNVLFLLFLSSFNWFFEFLKWKHLASIVNKISFKEALEQSLGSLTASLFTPNRVGEYGAKAMYYNSNSRKQILLINLISNMMQMGTTLIFGMVGLSLFMFQYKLPINHINIIVLGLVIMIIGIITRYILNNDRFTIRGYSIKKIKDYILKLPRHRLLNGFVYSIIRYIIFSFQFYILLLIFKINLGYFDAMTIITSIYLLSSTIPSIFILDVIVKGSIAVYLFSFLGINELTILSIITIMWLFNFVLPSIFGSYFVLTFKPPKAYKEV